METKSLAYGIAGFLIGGLLVSVAATTFEKPQTATAPNDSMSHMQDALAGKYGDEFDKEFIEQMIVHHQGAIEMAKLANSRGKHEEIKTLSKNIISAQESEINDMRKWQTQWKYSNDDSSSLMNSAH